MKSRRKRRKQESGKNTPRNTYTSRLNVIKNAFGARYAHERVLSEERRPGAKLNSLPRHTEYKWIYFPSRAPSSLRSSTGAVYKAAFYSRARNHQRDISARSVGRKSRREGNGKYLTWRGRRNPTGLAGAIEGEKSERADRRVQPVGINNCRLAYNRGSRRREDRETGAATVPVLRKTRGRKWRNSNYRWRQSASRATRRRRRV